MLSRRHFLIIIAGAPISGLIATTTVAQAAPVYANDGIAVEGSDVVSYFTQGAPLKGLAEFFYIWNGTTWHFANATNRDTFAADPAAYAPQYGGYCAWAVSEGYIAPTVPEAWRIVDGKLYLNFRGASNVAGNEIFQPGSAQPMPTGRLS